MTYTPLAPCAHCGTDRVGIEWGRAELPYHHPDVVVCCCAGLGPHGGLVKLGIYVALRVGDPVPLPREEFEGGG